MKEPNETSGKKKKKQRQAPGKTLEAREKQIVHLAIDLAEEQIRKGTASSQVITHFLKLGSISEDLAREKLRSENLLLKAKTEALASAKRVEELYSEALRAMREYSGQSLNHVADEDDYDD